MKKNRYVPQIESLEDRRLMNGADLLPLPQIAAKLGDNEPVQERIAIVNRPELINTLLGGAQAGQSGTDSLRSATLHSANGALSRLVGDGTLDRTGPASPSGVNPAPLGSSGPAGNPFEVSSVPTGTLSRPDAVPPVLVPSSILASDTTGTGNQMVFNPANAVSDGLVFNTNNGQLPAAGADLSGGVTLDFGSIFGETSAEQEPIPEGGFGSPIGNGSFDDTAELQAQDEKIYPMQDAVKRLYDAAKEVLQHHSWLNRLGRELQPLHRWAGCCDAVYPHWSSAFKEFTDYLGEVDRWWGDQGANSFTLAESSLDATARKLIKGSPGRIEEFLDQAREEARALSESADPNKAAKARQFLRVLAQITIRFSWSWMPSGNSSHRDPLESKPFGMGGPSGPEDGSFNSNSFFVGSALGTAGNISYANDAFLSTYDTNGVGVAQPPSGMSFLVGLVSYPIAEPPVHASQEAFDSFGMSEPVSDDKPADTRLQKAAADADQQTLLAKQAEAKVDQTGAYEDCVTADGLGGGEGNEARGGDAQPSGPAPQLGTMEDFFGRLGMEVPTPSYAYFLDRNDDGIPDELVFEFPGGRAVYISDSDQDGRPDSLEFDAGDGVNKFGFFTTQGGEVYFFLQIERDSKIYYKAIKIPSPPEDDSGRIIVSAERNSVGDVSSFAHKTSEVVKTSEVWTGTTQADSGLPATPVLDDYFAASVRDVPTTTIPGNGPVSSFVEDQNTAALVLTGAMEDVLGPAAVQLTGAAGGDEQAPPPPAPATTDAAKDARANDLFDAIRDHNPKLADSLEKLHDDRPELFDALQGLLGLAANSPEALRRFFDEVGGRHVFHGDSDAITRTLGADPEVFDKLLGPPAPFYWKNLKALRDLQVELQKNDELRQGLEGLVQDSPDVLKKAAGASEPAPAEEGSGGQAPAGPEQPKPRRLWPTRPAPAAPSPPRPANDSGDEQKERPGSDVKPPAADPSQQSKPMTPAAADGSRLPAEPAQPPQTGPDRTPTTPSSAPGQLRLSDDPRLWPMSGWQGPYLPKGWGGMYGWGTEDGSSAPDADNNNPPASPPGKPPTAQPQTPPPATNDGASDAGSGTGSQIPLQDQQVAIDAKLVTLTDAFFESFGLDFDPLSNPDTPPAANPETGAPPTEQNAAAALGGAVVTSLAGLNNLAPQPRRRPLPVGPAQGLLGKK